MGGAELTGTSHSRKLEVRVRRGSAAAETADAETPPEIADADTAADAMLSGNVDDIKPSGKY